MTQFTGDGRFYSDAAARGAIVADGRRRRVYDGCDERKLRLTTDACGGAAPEHEDLIPASPRNSNIIATLPEAQSGQVDRG